jgi:hypothetical protein
MGQGWYRFGFEVEPGEAAEGGPRRAQIALAATRATSTSTAGG